MTSRLALVTGATGHIGGRLVPELLDRGWRVRVLSRGELPADTEWAERVESVHGDASDAGDVREALSGVNAAWYLLHSMDGRGDFVVRDRAMAELFARTAAEEGVGRLVYLSGLHPDEELSPHLASRVEVGEILLGSGVPTAVLQAGVVLGAGSASFEMLRHLTERLPAVVAPKWLGSRIQPIADSDVVHLLASAADLPPEVNRTFDVGGPDVLTYADLMRRYAAVTGLGRRFIKTVPVLTPGLASHWVGLVTPVASGVARPLVGSLVHGRPPSPSTRTRGPASCAAPRPSSAAQRSSARSSPRPTAGGTAPSTCPRGSHRIGRSPLSGPRSTRRRRSPRRRPSPNCAKQRWTTRQRHSSGPSSPTWSSTPAGLVCSSAATGRDWQQPNAQCSRRAAPTWPGELLRAERSAEGSLVHTLLGAVSPPP